MSDGTAERVESLLAKTDLHTVRVSVMCEVVALYRELRYGETVSPEEVFNYSPTGELSAVWGWYVAAEPWLRGYLAGAR